MDDKLINITVRRDDLEGYPLSNVSSWDIYASIYLLGSVLSTVFVVEKLTTDMDVPAVIGEKLDRAAKFADLMTTRRTERLRKWFEEAKKRNKVVT